MDKSAIIAAVMALSQGEFADCNFAVMASYDDGTPIVALNQTRKMCPASNLKVITTGAALESLGSDFRWETSIGYSGMIDGCGTLHGDVYVIGDMDPMLGSDDAAAKPLEEEFSAWTGMIRKEGIRRIDGYVVADGRSFDGELQESSWWYSDLGFYYATRLSGLNFYENRINVSVRPGNCAGDSLIIDTVYPRTPWMQWTFDCTSGEASTGDRLYYYTDSGSPKGVFTGTYAIDKAGGIIGIRNNYPELSLSMEFCNYLENNGIAVDKGPAQILDGALVTSGFETVPLRDTSVCVVGSTQSPPLLEVVRETNRVSNNFYAEILFRTMGKKLRSSAGIDSSREALKQVLTDIIGVGADPRQIVIRDGSGTSNANLMSPEYLCRYLCTMTRLPHFRDFIGSLTTMMDGKVRYKTGSISGVRTLCGYVLGENCGEYPDGSGKAVVFSIMVGNSEFPTSKIDSLERRIIGMLAK